MGHAHHFLARLDRLARPDVELALALYRDDARLRYVLEQARLPERAERVAVSLDDPHEGPFVLVTRAGRFVTCLARGMRADNLPIITRADLDAITTKHVVLQEREAARERLAGADGGASFLLGRILDAGPFLAREELQALAALHPILGDEYFNLALEWAMTARRIQHDLRTALKKRGPRLRALQLEQLHLYWQLFFAAGHLAVLSLVDGGEMFRRRAGGDDQRFACLADGLTAIVVDGGIVTRMVRGSWALGQLGEAWIPHAKQRLAGAKNAVEVIGPAIGLLAIGARDASLRPDVLAAFDPVPQLTTEEARSWAAFLCAGGTALLGNVEGTLAAHREAGATVALGLRHLYPEVSPHHHYARPEDVPADIAYSAPFQLVAEVGRQPQLLPTAVTMVVAAACATPEQLYLPRRSVEFLERRWAPEQSLSLMEGWLHGLRHPAPRPTGPTRNGACPCGSGKKYKRCCADHPAASA